MSFRATEAVRERFSNLHRDSVATIITPPGQYTLLTAPGMVVGNGKVVLAKGKANKATKFMMPTAQNINDDDVNWMERMNEAWGLHFPFQMIQAVVVGNRLRWASANIRGDMHSLMDDERIIEVKHEPVKIVLFRNHGFTLQLAEALRENRVPVRKMLRGWQFHRLGMQYPIRKEVTANISELSAA